MNTYIVGETIEFGYTCKKDAVAYDPVTSVNIVTYDAGGVVDTESTAMTNTETGVYTYDYQSSAKAAGIYKAVVTATDGTEVTITSLLFKLI